jgi:hypothetical protein
VSGKALLTQLIETADRPSITAVVYPVCCCCSPSPIANLQLADASSDSSSYYTRGTLHKATLLLTDFGRAVPFKQLAAEQGAFDVEQPDTQPPWGRTSKYQGISATGEVTSRQTTAYNPDGMVVMADPTLRPPEVRPHVTNTGINVTCLLTLLLT